MKNDKELSAINTITKYNQRTETIQKLNNEKGKLNSKNSSNNN